MSGGAHSRLPAVKRKDRWYEAAPHETGSVPSLAVRAA